VKGRLRPQSLALPGKWERMELVNRGGLTLQQVGE